MAYELATAYVSLTVETKDMGRDIAKQFDDVQRQADKSGQGIGDRLASGMGKALKRGALVGGAAAGAALGTALYKGMGRLDGIEQAEAKLSGLGHSAQGTAQIMDDALTSVRGTAFGLEEAATVAASAVAAGIKPGQELERVLSLTGDAATIAGVSMAEMGDIFNKVASSNKMQGDVINQLNTAGIPIVQLLGEELGKTSEEITEMSRKGQIDFQMFADAMESGLGGAALKSGDTFRGALANMGAAAGRFGAEVLRPLHEQSKGWIGGLTDLIDDATERVKPLAAAFGAWLADATPKFAEFARSAADAFQSFRESDVVRETLRRLGGVFTQLMDTAEKIGPSIRVIAESLAEAASNVGVSAWKIFLTTIEGAAKILDATLVPALRVLADLMEKNQAAVTLLVGAFAAFKTIPSLVTKISTALAPVANVAKTASTQLKSVAAANQMVADAGRFGSVQMGRFGSAIATVGQNVPVIQRMQGAFYEGAAGADRFGRMAGAAAAASSGLQSALGGVRSGISNVVAALGGPAGISIMGAATMLTMNASSAASADAAHRRLAEAAEQGAEAQRNLSGALIETNGQLDDQALGLGMQMVESHLAEITTLGERGHTSMENLGRAIDSVTFNVFGMNDEWEEQYDHVSAMEGQYKALKDVMEIMGISMKDVHRIVAEGGPEYDTLIDHLHDGRRNGDAVASALGKVHDEIQAMQDAAKNVAPSFAEISAGFKQIADNAADAEARASGLDRVLRAIAGEPLDVFEAEGSAFEFIDRSAESAKQLRDAAKGFGDELFDANHNLNGVHENARDLGSFLSSARTEAAGVAAAGGDLDAVMAGIMENAYAWGESLGISREDIDAIVARAGIIPEVLEVGMHIDGADEAKSQLAAIYAESVRMDGEPIVVPIEALGDEAQEVLRNTGATIKEIDDGRNLEIVIDADADIDLLKQVLTTTDEIPEYVGISVDADGEQARTDLLEIIDLAQDEDKLVVIDSNADDQIALMEALGIEITEMPNGDYVVTDNIPEVRARIEELKKPTSSTHTVTINERLGNSVRRASAAAFPEYAATRRADGGFTAFAQGGFLPDQATIEPGRGAGLVQWAEGETGGEAFIPLAQSKRGRSMQILEEVARRFGVGLTAFADGGIRAAISAARSKEGLPYVWGGTGPDGFDCSGFVGWLQQIVMGLSEVEAAGKRLYTTHSLLGGSTAGLVRGDDPNSPFRVGVNDGHMAATLAGHNVESGGASSPSSSGIGPGRAGADHPQFTARFHLPANLVAGGDGDSIDAYGISGSAWSEEDDRKLEGARLNLQSAIEARDRAYEQNKSDLDKQAADLRVQRAELDVRELEQKREGGGGASSMLVSAAPAIDGAMDDDAIRLRQAEIAVLDAQLSRDQTYSDPSSTTLDKEKADLALYSAQNALAQAQQDASSGAEPGSVKEILQRFASDAVGIAYDSVWEIFGVSQPHWMDVAIPQPKKPGKPAESMSRDEALADARPTDDLDLPVARSEMDEWLKRQGIALHDEGGWLEPGLTLNLTKKPEAVLNPEQLEALYAVADMGNELRGKQPQTVINNHNNQQFMNQDDVLRDVARQTTKALVRAGMAAL